MKRAWLLALSACAADGAHATAIAVSVKSELALGTELRQLEYRAYRENADLAVEPPLWTQVVLAGQLAQPFVVVRGEADTFLLSIEGYADRTQPPVITYQARLRFVPEQTMALRVLLARVCFQRDCGFRGLTCLGQASAEHAAGTCAAIPMPALVRVEQPGDESDW